MGASTVWMGSLPEEGLGKRFSQGPLGLVEKSGESECRGWGSGEHKAPEMGPWLSVSPGMWCSAGKNVMATALAH